MSGNFGMAAQADLKVVATCYGRCRSQLGNIVKPVRFSCPENIIYTSPGEEDSLTTAENALRCAAD